MSAQTPTPKGIVERLKGHKTLLSVIAVAIVLSIIFFIVYQKKECMKNIEKNDKQKKIKM
jgi:hypothetical protein